MHSASEGEGKGEGGGDRQLSSAPGPGLVGAVAGDGLDHEHELSPPRAKAKGAAASRGPVEHGLEEHEEVLGVKEAEGRGGGHPRRVARSAAQRAEAWRRALHLREGAEARASRAGRFAGIKTELLRLPDSDDVDDDPLGANAGAAGNTSSSSGGGGASTAWASYFHDRDLLDEIKQDLNRLVGEDAESEDFFERPDVHDSLCMVLFLWSKRHSATSYRQGMHEILAPLYFAAWSERADSAESEAFWMFEKILESLEPLYEVSREHDQERVLAGDLESARQSHVVRLSHRIQDELLRGAAPELHKHLQELDVHPQLYALRWLRLMFAHSTVSLSCTLRLWDAILEQTRETEDEAQTDDVEDAASDNPLLVTLTVFALALLISKQHVLLDTDEVLQELMYARIAIQDLEGIIELAYRLRVLGVLPKEALENMAPLPPPTPPPPPTLPGMDGHTPHRGSTSSLQSLGSQHSVPGGAGVVVSAPPSPPKSVLERLLAPSPPPHANSAQRPAAPFTAGGGAGGGGGAPAHMATSSSGLFNSTGNLLRELERNVLESIRQHTNPDDGLREEIAMRHRLGARLIHRLGELEDELLDKERAGSADHETRVLQVLAHMKQIGDVLLDRISENDLNS